MRAAAVMASAADAEERIGKRIGEHAGERSPRARLSRRTARRAFFGISALLFGASATATVLWCASMSAMGGMPMPRGWTLSMVWMRMPGQTWPGAGAAFLGMWTTMMVAMMLPSLTPALWRYVGDACVTGRRASALAALAGAGYFSVWIVLGAAVFLAGIVLAALEMQEPELARAVPVASGAIVLAAGALQFTGWKARYLALCRQVPCSRRFSAASLSRGTSGGGRVLLEDATAAVRCGLRLGLHCTACSAGLTAILLVAGAMDLRAMAAVTAAVTLERLAPAGERTAHAIGAMAIVAGLALVISAA